MQSKVLNYQGEVWFFVVFIFKASDNEDSVQLRELDTCSMREGGGVVVIMGQVAPTLPPACMEALEGTSSETHTPSPSQE